MKKLIFILAVFSALISNAQKNFVIIYVDASESEKSLDIIQDKIKYLLIDNKDDSEIFLYISNNIVGDDGSFSTRSFTTTDANEGIRMMENIYLQKNLNKNQPDYLLDTKDINSYLLSKNCLSDINSSDFHLQNSIRFFFFLDDESYEESVKEGKCIINLIAHANRLVDKEGKFITNCSIFKKIVPLGGGEMKTDQVKNL